MGGEGFGQEEEAAAAAAAAAAVGWKACACVHRHVRGVVRQLRVVALEQVVLELGAW